MMKRTLFTCQDLIAWDRPILIKGHNKWARTLNFNFNLATPLRSRFSVFGETPGVRWSIISDYLVISQLETSFTAVGLSLINLFKTHLWAPEWIYLLDPLYSNGLPNLKGKANKLDVKRRLERKHELVNIWLPMDLFGGMVAILHSVVWNCLWDAQGAYTYQCTPNHPIISIWENISQNGHRITEEVH